MTDIAINFKNCTTCGKYIKITRKKRYNHCSAICRTHYCKCNTCGKYFESDSPNTGFCSVKCKMVFSLNKKGVPYIKTTPYKIIITGAPVISNEIISDRLSKVLKLPLLMTEKIKREYGLSPNNVFYEIEKLKNTENNGDFFILLCNSYDIDFISAFASAYDIDIVINIVNRRENFRKDEIIRCAECLSINSFSEADSEGNKECMICKCPDFKNVDTKNAVKTKERKYSEITDFFKEKFKESYLEFPVENTTQTINKITSFFVYS